MIETHGTVLYEKNAYNKVKMASTTKIMTATVVIENCNLNEVVTVSKKAASTGGSRVGLKTGDKVSVNDLLYGLMLFSGNDTAVALAEHVAGSVDNFAEMMNNKASELGLKNSHFKTPHGLDKEDHYTTAYELSILSDYALKNKTFANIVNTKTTTININGNSKTINNTNELLGNLNGIYGIKTGFTNGANRCLVTACKRDNLDIICVVLGADTKKFRTDDSVKLIEYTFANFTPINISEIARKNFEDWKKENLGNFSIYKQSSLSQSLDLILNTEEKDIVIPIEKSKVNSLDFKVTCEKKLISPINSNTCLGNLDIILEDKTIYKRDILLKNDIYNKKALEYFVDILKKLPF